MCETGSSYLFSVSVYNINVSRQKDYECLLFAYYSLQKKNILEVIVEFYCFHNSRKWSCLSLTMQQAWSVNLGHSNYAPPTSDIRFVPCWPAQTERLVGITYVVLAIPFCSHQEIVAHKLAWSSSRLLLLTVVIICSRRPWSPQRDNFEYCTTCTRSTMLEIALQNAL